MDGKDATRHARGRLGGVAAVMALLAALVATGAPATAGHPTEADPSTGIYRIPYDDGTDVFVINDTHGHSPLDRIDMAAGTGTTIVAAASGWIRAVVDNHGNSPNPGDDVDINGDPQDDTLEHSCGNNDPMNTVVGGCSAYNNYVWIEHPNGEWTKYTHFGTGTVTANGWSVGDWIDAGEALGLESDIGAASGNILGSGTATHLHFEVGLPFDPTDLTPFCASGGFMLGGGCGTFGVNLVPMFCDVPGNELLNDNTIEPYEANPCSNNTAPTADADGPYTVDEGDTVLLDGSASFDPEGLPLTYLWSPDTNLDDASLEQPTFTGVDDEFRILVLQVFDTVEAVWTADFTSVTVNNVAPTVVLDVETVTFPGGDHAVVQPGEELPATADGSDPGSDDLIFDWSTGDTNVYFNDGMNPDPFPSPDGTWPFAATDAVDAIFAAPGAEAVEVVLSDDDGGTDTAAAGAVVVGTADSTQGAGWWKHQFAGTGSPQLDEALLAGYLETVDAVSGVFSEAVALQTAEQAHAVLSPTNDWRDQARAELLVAWLQFASGAVAWDATVDLGGGAGEVAFLDLMGTAESVILDGGASDAALKGVARDLARVRHAA